MRGTEDAGWTTALGFKTRHASADAVFFGDSVGGNDDAIPLASATDPDRAFLQFRIEGDFAACKKAVAINVQDAAQHYNENVNVCAKVFGIKALDNLTLVNLGAAYPNQPLTIVLRDAARDIGPGLDGKNICVTGMVVSYRNKPEIVVTDPKMITASNQ